MIPNVAQLLWQIFEAAETLNGARIASTRVDHSTVLKLS
jgi:hypothetical protein